MNKEGSEYDPVYLDALLRQNKHYDRFSQKLIIRRIREAGMLPGLVKSEGIDLATFFEISPNSALGREETAFVLENYQNTDRPYLVALARKLGDGAQAGVAWGVSRDKQIEEIIRALSVPEYPLVEKVNLLLFYRDWYRRKNLLESATRIKKDSDAYIETLSTESRHHETLLHFRSDLIAQLYRECRQSQCYSGIDSFISMSCGLPRNLLIILKQVFRWSVFNGETPFGEKPISLNSEKAGVDDASEWFFRDARMTGSSGPDVQKCVSQLAELFREIRFTDNVLVQRELDNYCRRPSGSVAGLTWVL
jgi:hypothetical protein